MYRPKLCTEIWSYLHFGYFTEYVPGAHRGGLKAQAGLFIGAQDAVVVSIYRLHDMVALKCL